MLKRRREKQQQMEIVIMEQMVPEDHFLRKVDRASEADLMRGISHFIAFYNAERPHSTLQYKTPEQTEQDYWL